MNYKDRLKEMIKRNEEELETIKTRIQETSAEEQDKLRRFFLQATKKEYYIMGLETALVYYEQEEKYN